MLNRIEKQIKRRFVIGSQVSEHAIVQDFSKQKYPERAIYKVKPLVYIWSFVCKNEKTSLLDKCLNLMIPTFAKSADFGLRVIRNLKTVIQNSM